MKDYLIAFLLVQTSAYLYEVYGNEAYLSKTAHASNCGTAGFLISTLSYVIIYHQCGIEGLLLSTMAAGTAAAIFSIKLKPEPSKNKQTCYAKENEAENKNFAKKETYAFNIEETVKIEETAKQGEHSIKQLLSVMKHPRALLFASALSIFQVSWLLINFFYVEKLGECGISPEWMSAVILGYSAVEMLAEPIIRKLGTSFSKSWAASIWHSLWCGLSGIRLCLKAYPHIASNACTSASLKAARIFCHGAGKCAGRSAWRERTACSGVIRFEYGRQHHRDIGTICVGSADCGRNWVVLSRSRSASNCLYVMRLLNFRTAQFFRLTILKSLLY